MIPSDQASTQPDLEIESIAVIYSTLTALPPDAQRRVLDYVVAKLGLATQQSFSRTRNLQQQGEQSSASRVTTDPGELAVAQEAEGISPSGRKWMVRSELDSNQLGAIFSIGGEDIDLIAKQVPGKTTKDRMRSVFLLKGIASYLSTGAPRITHGPVREACSHYDAFDTKHFAKYLKSFSTEISGSKATGYSLTSRGLAEATELVKGMVKAKGM